MACSRTSPPTYANKFESAYTCAWGSSFLLHFLQEVHALIIEILFNNGRISTRTCQTVDREAIPPRMIGKDQDKKTGNTRGNQKSRGKNREAVSCHSARSGAGGIENGAQLEVAPTSSKLLAPQHDKACNISSISSASSRMLPLVDFA